METYLLFFFSMLVNLTRGCNQTVVAEQGTITSPDYPNHYANNLYCVYTITVPSGNNVLLSFTDFDLESGLGCSRDYFQANDGEKFCGYIVPDPISTSSNQMTIVLFSDQSSAGRGFNATFTGIETATTTSTPGTTVTNPTTSTTGATVTSFISTYSATTVSKTTPTNTTVTASNTPVTTRSVTTSHSTVTNQSTTNAIVKRSTASSSKIGTIPSTEPVTTRSVVTRIPNATNGSAVSNVYPSYETASSSGNIIFLSVGVVVLIILVVVVIILVIVCHENCKCCQKTNRVRNRPSSAWR